VSVPEAGKSETPVDIKTVRTMPLMTIKCKGSLEAVRHSLFGIEGQYDGWGIGSARSTQRDAARCPTGARISPAVCMELAVPLGFESQDEE
jgi:hypothetical protein